MRIRITDGQHRMNIILPTGLIFSRPVVRLYNTFGRRYAGDAMTHISPEALEAICAELRRVKKRHGKWELVDVESAYGQRVRITL